MPEQIIGKLQEAEVSITAIYTDRRKAAKHFDIDSLSPIRLPPHQSPQFILAHRVVALKNAHGLMPARCHDAEVVMALEPPVIDCRVPQIVKGKVLYPCPPTSGNKAPMHLGYGSPLVCENRGHWQAHGHCLEHSNYLGVKRY